VGKPLPLAVKGNRSSLSKHGLRKVIQLIKPEPTNFVLQMVLAWTGIAAAIFISEYFGKLWITVPALYFIATRQKILALLVHEQIHNNGLPQSWGNLFTNIFYAFPILITVEDYGNVHLSHHRLYFTQDDPDYHRKNGADWTFPQKMSRFFLGLAMDLFGGGFLESLKARRFGKIGRVYLKKKPIDRITRLAFYLTLFILLTVTQSWGDYGFYWILPLATIFQLFIKLGALLEHKYNLINHTIAEATPMVQFSWLENLINPDLNLNGYHIYHHYWPSIPYRKLPKAQEIFRQEGLLNDENIFKGTFSYFKYILSRRNS